MLDPFQLPFMQRAALEIVLLAPLAGAARRADRAPPPRLLHPRGRRRGLPRPRRRRAGRHPPRARGARRRRRLRRPCSSGSAAAAGVASDAATALLLVAALAIGIVLASDVFESGAGVDQLLFGSLLAIGAGELLVTGRRPRPSSLAAAALPARPGSPPASTSSAAARLGLPVAAGRRRPARRGRARRDRRRSTPSAPCWSARSSSSRRRRRGSSPAASPASRPAPRRSRSSRGSPGCSSPTSLDVPPGAAIAVLGGVVFARLPAGRELADRAAAHAAAGDAR